MGEAKQIIAVLIPIIISLGVFAMIVLIRRMENAERLKMIEKGIDLSKAEKPHKKGGSIKMALVAVGVGLGLLMGNVIDSYTSLDDETAYFSMIFLFAGAGLFIADRIVDKQIEKEKMEGK